MLCTPVRTSVAIQVLKISYDLKYFEASVAAMKAR